MRKTLTSTTLALALLAGSSSWALAQSGGSSGDTGGTTGALTSTPRAKTDDAVGTRGTEVTTPGTTDAAGTGSAAGTDNPIYGMRGDQIVGKTLYSVNGEEIGEIDNVVMRMGGLRPEALVDVGGFLGVGGREVAVPLDQIQLVGERLTTTMTKDSISNMQAYDEAGYDDYDQSRMLGTTTQ
jgi:sporulation protein YlmC with PRC-barrel domain